MQECLAYSGLDVPTLHCTFDRHRNRAQPVEERAGHRAGERLDEEFKGRIKPQTVLSSAGTADMLCRAMLAPMGQVSLLLRMRGSGADGLR